YDDFISRPRWHSIWSGRRRTRKERGDGGERGRRGQRKAVQPRRHERRRGFEQLLAALTRGIDRRADVALLRGTLEQLVRRIVPVRSVHITDLNGRWSPRIERTGLESISLEIPGVDTSAPRLLEATFDPGCPLGEWDFQMLAAATNVAALVLEIERTRTL